MGNKSAKDIKALIEADRVFKAKLDSIGVKVDDFIASTEEEKKANLNELYDAFKKKNEGLPDVPPEPTPTPEPTPEPIPEPQPAGDLLYDSNTDINWDGIPGDSQVVTGVYGEFKPNGKYFRMKASGNPRMILMKATKELILEHGGKYGRAYFGVCNYQSKLECDFKLDSCSNGFSAKLRNRHQYHDIVSSAPNTQAQGGMGCGIKCDSVDNDLEVFHDGGGEVSGPQKSISPKLEANKYYHVNFSQFDKNGKIHITVEIDGKQVNEGDLSAPSQFFKEAEFMEWSEFWVRYNADNGGRLTVKNLKLYKL